MHQREEMTEQKGSIRQYLQANRLITDGAMGTYYTECGGKEELAEFGNISEPDLIKNIHREYIDSGAKLIRTNTFACNTTFFQDMGQVRENIHAAWRIAKEVQTEALAEGRDVFVAADIGPIDDGGDREDAEIFAEYREICNVFLAEGAEIFVFETHSQTMYLRETAEYIKQRNPQAFIWVQMAFNRSGYTKLGLGIRSFIREMAAAETIDAYGLNCSVSSAHMYGFLKDVVFAAGKPVSVLPNASYPLEVRGRVLYSKNISYFAQNMAAMAELGVEILGGCCGTSPAYTKAMAEALADVPLTSKKEMDMVSAKAGRVENPTAGMEVPGQDSQNVSQEKIHPFMEKVCSGKKVFLVELDPPFDTDIHKVMEVAKLLKEQGADIITLSDSPLARPRMDVGLLAAKLQREMEIPVMPHISCRDRNMIALRGMFLGLHANDIRNLLLVTGDPIARTDQPAVKPVYNVNSIKLMKYVKQMNAEHFPEDGLVYGGALNYHGVNGDAIAKRMQDKVDAGAEYFLTQPIYSSEDIERIRFLRSKVNTRIFCGIMPLVSYRNARFIRNEMPGIHVPDEIMAQYPEGLTREEYEKRAVAICVELAGKMEDVADGFYFMPPFNRVHLICEIMNALR